MCRACNAMLAVGVVLIVLIFKSSDALAAAYGIAVTGVMVISTVLVARGRAPSLELEARRRSIAVFGAAGPDRSRLPRLQRLKIVEGGWLPLAVAAAIFRGDGHLAAWAGGCIWTRCATMRWRWTCSWTRADKFSQRIAGTAVFLSPRAGRGAQRRCCTA